MSNFLRQRQLRARVSRKVAAKGQPDAQGWIRAAERLPNYDTDREAPGDTISKRMYIANEDRHEMEIANFHFPTEAWCRRSLDFVVTHWRPLGGTLPPESGPL